MASASERGTRLLYDGKVSQPDLVDSSAEMTALRDTLSGFEADKPILMFPVRLETKYIPIDPESPEQSDLWIRIYPDQLLAKSHETRMTADEIDAGKDYWKVHFNEQNPEKTLEAWSKLCLEYETPRAAYLLQALKPSSVSYPGSPIDAALTHFQDLNVQLDGYLAGNMSGFSSSAYLDTVLTAVNDAFAVISSISECPSNFSSDLLQEISLFQSRFDIFYDDRVNPWDIIAHDALESRNAGGSRTPSTSTNGVRDYHKGTRPYSNRERRFPALVPIKAQIDQGLSNARTAIEGYTPIIAEAIFTWPYTQQARPHYFYEQPYTDMLPDRFVAIGMVDTATGLDIEFIEFGAGIPSDLKVGPKPLNSDTEEEDVPFRLDENGDMIFEDSLKWMFELDVAETNGMAIKVPNARDNYSKILVLGVNGGTLEQSKTSLQELFMGHQYTEAMSILRIGTPTNNTIGEPSGFSEQAEDFSLSHSVHSSRGLISHQSDLAKRSDGQRLAEVMGLNLSTFQKVSNAESTDISELNKMKRVLFPATLGDHMEEMLGTLLNQDNRERIKDYFENWVTSRGTAPAFRVGDQPYGVHVASRLHNFHVTGEEDVYEEGQWNEGTLEWDEDPGTHSFTAMTQDIGDGGTVEVNEVHKSNMFFEHAIDLGDPQLHQKRTEDLGNYAVKEFFKIDTSVIPEEVWQKRFDVRFKEALKFLDVEWRKVAEERAKNVYIKNIEEHNPTDSKAQFMEIFGRQAHTVEYATRHIAMTGEWNADINTSAPYRVAEHIYERQIIAGANPANSLREFLIGENFDNLDSPNFVASTFPKGVYPHSDTDQIEPDHPACLNISSEFSKKIDGILGLRITNSPVLNTLTGHIANALEPGAPDFDELEHHPSFIDELIATHPNDLYANNDKTSLAGKSLLYLLLRSSILLNYREAACKILVSEDITDQASIDRLGHPENSFERNSESQTPKSEFTGIMDDTSLSPSRWWVYTKWNALLEPLYGRYMYFLNGSELAPSAYYYRQWIDGASPKQTWTYWNMMGFDPNAGTLSPAWKESQRDSPKLEFIVSKTRYDSNQLVEYLRPYSNGQGTSPFDDVSDVENTFFKKYYGLDWPGSNSDMWSPLHEEFKELSGINEWDELSEDPSEEEEKSLADYLYSIVNSVLGDGVAPTVPDQVFHFQHIDNLISSLESTKELKELDTSTLEALMGETMDLSTYRLDGWIQGLIAKRLHELREDDPEGGSHFGAFGYIENLDRFGLDDIPLNKTLVDPVEEVYKDHESDGYILTPSLTHAVTASILRSGYLTSFKLEKSDVRNRLSVNLSSKRVRLAMDFLDGIRNGQELGELLGYKFEKALHERASNSSLEMDVYIHRLRRKFPLSRAGEEIGQDVHLRYGAVFNGLDLVDHVLAFTSHLGPNETIFSFYKGSVTDFGLNDEENVVPVETDMNEFKAFLFELNELVQSFDALADLVVSEGVYQIAGGNFDRATAFLDTMTGNKAIVDPEVTDFQRTGNSFYNKIVMNFETETDFDTAIPPFWDFGNGTRSTATDAPIGQVRPVLAVAEPSLNKWLGKAVGDPNKLYVKVEYRNTEEEEWIEDVVTLAELKIQPILFLQILAVNPATGSSELDRRIVVALRERLGLQLDSKIRVNYKQTDTAQEGMSLYECIPLLESLRLMLDKSMVLGASDFEVNQPEDTNSLQNFDLEEYQFRADGAIAFASDLYGTLSVDPSAMTLEQLKAGCDKLAEFGITGVRPIALVSLSDQDLLDDESTYEEHERLTYLKSIQRALLILENRISAAESLMTKAVGIEDHDSLFEALDSIMRTIFGKTVKCLPHFKFRNPGDIATARNNSSNLFSSEESGQDAIGAWFHQLARVRDKVSHFETFRMFYEIFDRPAMQLSPLQIPYASDDHWLGSEFPEEWIPSEKVNVLMTDFQQFPDNLGALRDSNFVGLKLDDWIEKIPDRDITAGVAFNYNAPNTESPQSLIQVVPCRIDDQAKWELEDVVYSIIETMDMAKYRVMDADDLISSNNWIGKVLPGASIPAYPMYDSEATADVDGSEGSFGITMDAAYDANNQ